MRILVFKVGGSIVPYILQDVMEAFKDLGHLLDVLDLTREGGLKEILTPKDIMKAIKEFAPDFVFCINYLGLASHIVTFMKIPYLCWFVDNPFYWTLPRESLTEYTLLLVADRGWINGLRDFGFEKVYHLPGATNPDIFKEITLSQEDIERYRCKISFVGSSSYPYYQKCLKEPREREIQLLMERIIRLLVKGSFEFDYLLKRQFRGVDLPSFFGFKSMSEFKASVEYAASAIYKKEIFERISDLGLHIYGDEGWKSLLGEMNTFFGWIDYRVELPKLYNVSEINLNITKLQLKTAINSRIFDISSCGGFLLTDYRHDLGRMFELGKEIVFYRDKEELRRLIVYYLKHSYERKELAKRAQKRVLREHTYRVRMGELIEIFQRSF